MNGVVLDASMTATWCFPDEQTAYTEQVFDLLQNPEVDVVAPNIWAYEVRNTVLSGLRRGRIDKRIAQYFLLRLRKLSVRLIDPGSLDSIFSLAEQHGLTFYDAAYLHVALLEGYPVASLDKALLRAAAAGGVDIFRPSDSYLQ